MEIRFRERFSKDIDDIHNQTVLDDIAKSIQIIEKAKTISDIANKKKMTNSKNAYRIRIGRYRIGFYLVDGIIELTRVLPRDKIYNYFPE